MNTLRKGRKMGKKGAIRSLAIFLIISTALIGSYFSFLFGVGAANNANIPSQYQSLINKYATSTPMKTAVGSLNQSIQSQLGTASTTGLTSIFGDIAVFGGLVTSVFGFLISIPDAFITLFLLLSAFGYIGTILETLGTIIISVMLVKIIFDDIISPVMKFPYR